MKCIYRIADAGYNKIKPEYINNELCLKNFCSVFSSHIDDVYIIADNCCEETLKMIKQYIHPENITCVSVGHGAGTFNLALDMALELDDDEVVYFVENDYLHLDGSDTILLEGIELDSVSFVSLYDHPDKYICSNVGGNPFIQDGGEQTKVYLTNSIHWKITNSTTMTFASKVRTLRDAEVILRKFTSGTHPNDFPMFIALGKRGKHLITPIPSYSTHGETQWLSPLVDWSIV
jgi:hypothetical protein